MAIDAALVSQALAARALTQLNKRAAFARGAVIGYEDGNFVFDQKVKVRRPRRRRAQNLDPRVGGINFNEGEFFNGDVALERLWVDGYPIYGSDAPGSLRLYVQETGDQMADAIISPNEDYLYDKFRTYTATTGAQEIGAHAPIRMTASLDANGELADFNADGIRHSATTLDGFEVPAEDRYCIMSTIAKGSFLGDSTLVDGFAAALNIGAGNLIRTGLPNAEFVPRYGFSSTGSTSVYGQTAENMLANAAGATVSAAADDTDFTYKDLPAGSNSIGATLLTLDATGTTIGPNVGVGQIVRLADAGNAHRYFGVILRIDTSTATAPVLTIVLNNAKGALVSAADITQITAATALTATVLSVGSVNVAYHREALLIANRFLQEPSEGSGATATSLRDPQTNMTIQLFNGSYDLKTVSESRAAYMLTGALMSDVRKTSFILSK
ncbi:hypothetical protein D0962_23340 [Leptolyngbyaceae cyanobacterium CCMR0082]|uniref:Uncharacterized protein n=1 Tax=Adonisia turfae CCMR0082 TaxID=2304604 RepID=A0A6M0SB14_9CYAN|nr:hypothetical protein [Adonisia turfae]NEZ65654.1 hypothetical protein [Adonisia turfae CCMR0082]